MTLDQLIEGAISDVRKAFDKVTEAERLIYAGPITELKLPIIQAHSNLLSAKNELQWMARERGIR